MLDHFQHLQKVSDQSNKYISRSHHTFPLPSSQPKSQIFNFDVDRFGKRFFQDPYIKLSETQLRLQNFKKYFIDRDMMQNMT